MFKTFANWLLNVCELTSTSLWTDQRRWRNGRWRNGRWRNESFAKRPTLVYENESPYRSCLISKKTMLIISRELHFQIFINEIKISSFSNIRKARKFEFRYRKPSFIACNMRKQNSTILVHSLGLWLALKKTGNKIFDRSCLSRL